MQLIPYVYYPGTCEEAFNFYVQTIGGKIAIIIKYNSMPPGAMSPPPEFGEKAMHGAYIGPSGFMLMATDAAGDMYRKPEGMDIMLSVDTPEEADRIWNAFVEGGEITAPIGETFWAHRFGKVKDRWGIPWMINCPKPMGPPPANP